MLRLVIVFLRSLRIPSTFSSVVIFSQDVVVIGVCPSRARPHAGAFTILTLITRLVYGLFWLAPGSAKRGFNGVKVRLQSLYTRVDPGNLKIICVSAT